MTDVMQALGSWLQNIILLILLATFSEFLLPSNALGKYARMVFSLLILLAILGPILQLLQKGVDDAWLEELVISRQPAAEAGYLHEAAIVGEVQAEQWQKQAKRGMEREIAAQLEQHFPVRVKEVEVIMRGESNPSLSSPSAPEVASVSVVLSQRGSEKAAQAGESEEGEEGGERNDSTRMAGVRPVKIDVEMGWTSSSVPSSLPLPHEREMTQMVASLYDLSADQVTLIHQATQ